MHIAGFIGELQHFENSKPLYFSNFKWAISLILFDQVTYAKLSHSRVVLLRI